jgi:hypothetical protein
MERANEAMAKPDFTKRGNLHRRQLAFVGILFPESARLSTESDHSWGGFFCQRRFPLKTSQAQSRRYGVARPSRNSTQWLALKDLLSPALPSKGGEGELASSTPGEDRLAPPALAPLSSMWRRGAGGEEASAGARNKSSRRGANFTDTDRQNGSAPRVVAATHGCGVRIWRCSIWTLPWPRTSTGYCRTC